MGYLKQGEGRTKQKQPQQKSKVKTAREKQNGASDYGRFYFCVKTSLSENGEIYVFADKVQYLPSGAVVFLGSYLGEADDGHRSNLTLAPGQWDAVYAASCLDGHAVAVDRWQGEIQR